MLFFKLVLFYELEVILQSSLLSLLLLPIIPETILGALLELHSFHTCVTI